MVYFEIILECDKSIADIYISIGKFLRSYKSGKLPKAVKTLPSLKNWLHYLELTEPFSWSPQATYQIVSIFVSNLPPKSLEM